MKIHRKDPPRAYEAGFDIKRIINDCGRVELEPDEQLTFTTESNAEYDVTRKDFGFYATPSINGRLAQFNIRTALAKNRLNRLFILLVEKGKEDLFFKYLQEEKMDLILWLDDPAVFQKLAALK